MTEYPTELIERATFELNTFERVSADTGEELLQEVIRLRVALKQMTIASAPGWRNEKGEGH